MASPKYRLIAKNRSTGASAEFGVIWENERGFLNIQFATPTDVEKSQGRKVSAVSVLSTPEQYFFNMFENKPQGAKKSASPFVSEGSDIDF